MEAVATADAVATLAESSPLSLLSTPNTSPRNSAILAPTEDEVSLGLSDELLSPDDEPVPSPSLEGSRATSSGVEVGDSDSTGAGAGGSTGAGSGSGATAATGSGAGATTGGSATADSAGASGSGSGDSAGAGSGSGGIGMVVVTSLEKPLIFAKIS